MIALLEHLLRRLANSIGGTTLLRLGLLVLALLSVEAGLATLVEHILSKWLPLTVLLAILLAWLFGRSRLPGWICAIALLFIGLIWLILSVGNLSVSIDVFLPSLPPILRMIIFRQPLELGPFQQSWSLFTQTLGGLASRLKLWIQNAGIGTLIIDPGITSLLWGLGLWLASAWAAWWLRRREMVVVGLFPPTTLLLYNVYYTNSDQGVIWIVLTGGCWIILQALDSYIKTRRRWEAGLLGRAEIEPALGAVMLVATVSLMLAGGVVPSISLQKISSQIQDIFQSRQDSNLARSLGLQRTPEIVPGSGVTDIGLSATHAIGPGPQLSQDVIMYVTVDGYQPPTPVNVLGQTGLIQIGPHFYWRSQIFDSYNGHFWSATTVLTQRIPANTPFHPNLQTLPNNYQVIRQYVERLQPMDGALFTAGELLDADQSSIAAWRVADDLIYARTDAIVYSADSLIQAVNVDELRSTGNKYPESIQTYLKLPDELPDRVRNLVVRLTINQFTPYDKVMAIQNYLRQFPYSLEVPGAPADREVADYFLFDLQKGYCDYFATTMAVMVRVVGIPSRLVVGFSSGAYDYNTHRFTVVRADAHAWVEVYFTGLGWVEFEPTTNLPPITRPGEKMDQNKPVLGIPNRVLAKGSGGDSFNWRILRLPLLILALVLACMAILGLAWLILPLESWILYLRSADKAVTAIQQLLYHQGRAWGVAPEAARTPLEFAYVFSTKLEDFARNQRLTLITADLKADMNWLTNLYSRLLFSPHPLTRAEHRQAVLNWARVRKGLRKIRISWLFGNPI